jgi:DNA-binding transcriptional LysR family regulator
LPQQLRVTASLNCLPGRRGAIKDGRLRRVLGDYTTPVGGLYAVYPSSRHVSPLVKAFIELAAARLAASGTGEDDKD